MFVAAHMASSRIEAFGSVALVLGLMVLGAVGFYLGIDIPPHRSARRAPGTAALSNDISEPTDPVELFSAVGTFLATLAAFFSVYIIVFDANPSTRSTVLLGFCWLLGGLMQIAAGISARRHRC